MSVSRIHRLIRLIVLLQSSRCYSANELAAELAVSRRTIFRDLRMLELAGIPFYYDRAAGGYRILSTFFLRPVSLNLEEALSILVLAQGLGQKAGIPYLSPAWRAANKIESSLPAGIREEIGSIAQHMRIAGARMTHPDHGEEVFNLCRRAVQERRKVRLVYGSLYEGRTIRTTLSPYALFFGERAWYLIGRSSMHRAVRMFKLDRVQEVALHGDGFRRPPSFSVERFLGNAWHLIRGDRQYTVRIRFQPKVATNVAEVRWHRTQSVAWQPDGSMIFTVTVAGVDEIAWWVLGYGACAEVLQPAALRRRVAAMLSEAADQYKP